MKHYTPPQFLSVKRSFPRAFTFLSLFVMACAGMYLFNACEDLSLTPDESQQQPALQDDSDEPVALRSDDPVIQRANRHFLHLAA
jgi:hypothetical protein